MLTYGAATYTHTANGERTRRIVGTDTTRTTYDALGGLTGARLPGGDSLRYLLDGQGRRVAQLRNGAMQRGWLYADAVRPVAELDGTGALLGRYVHATRWHVPDLVLRGDTAHRVVSDLLGSVRAVVRTSDGLVVQRREYDAWGVMTADTGGSFQSLGYAGGLTDTATGLVRFGARDYEPATGRWTAKDPIGFAGGLNVYEYAGGTPTSYVDAAGLAPASVGPLSGPQDYHCPPSPEWLRMGRSIQIAHSHRFNVFLFRDLVRTGGPWDYKQYGDPLYEPFGNFNYGVTGAAFGIPLSVLMNEAGRNQVAAQRPGRGHPSPIPGVPVGGRYPYGDHDADITWIERGYAYYRENIRGGSGDPCGCLRK